MIVQDFMPEDGNATTTPNVPREHRRGDLQRKVWRKQTQKNYYANYSVGVDQIMEPVFRNRKKIKIIQ